MQLDAKSALPWIWKFNARKIGSSWKFNDVLSGTMVSGIFLFFTGIVGGNAFKRREGFPLFPYGFDRHRCDAKRNRAIEPAAIRATTKFNCIYGYGTGTTIENGTGGRDRRREENKISKCVYKCVSNHPRKYNRASSNVFKFTVAHACTIETSFIPRLSLSPSPFLSFRIFPRGNFITYIAKHFHESRARFDPDASLTRNRESHPRD